MDVGVLVSVGGSGVNVCVGAGAVNVWVGRNVSVTETGSGVKVEAGRVHAVRKRDSVNKIQLRCFICDSTAKRVATLVKTEKI